MPTSNWRCIDRSSSSFRPGRLKSPRVSIPGTSFHNRSAVGDTATRQWFHIRDTTYRPPDDPVQRFAIEMLSLVGPFTEPRPWDSLGQVKRGLLCCGLKMKKAAVGAPTAHGGCITKCGMNTPIQRTRSPTYAPLHEMPCGVERYTSVGW